MFSEEKIHSDIESYLCNSILLCITLKNFCGPPGECTSRPVLQVEIQDVFFWRLA